MIKKRLKRKFKHLVTKSQIALERYADSTSGIKSFIQLSNGWPVKFERDKFMQKISFPESDKNLILKSGQLNMMTDRKI